MPPHTAAGAAHILDQRSQLCPHLHGPLWRLMGADYAIVTEPRYTMYVSCGGSRRVLFSRCYMPDTLFQTLSSGYKIPDTTFQISTVPLRRSTSCKVCYTVSLYLAILQLLLAASIIRNATQKHKHHTLVGGSAASRSPSVEGGAPRRLRRSLPVRRVAGIPL